jgi:hypothetical protein
MRTRTIRRAGLTLGVLGLLGLATATQSVAKVSVTPFKLFSRTAVGTTGRYTLLSVTPTGGGVLLDDVTGRKTPIPAPPPVCAEAPFGPRVGGGVITEGCLSQVDVYRLPAGPWRQMATPLDCVQQVETQDMGTCREIGVGAHWIRYELGCYHCPGDDHLYQNIDTGSLGDPFAGSDNFVDMNASSLTRPACAPLQVPASGDDLHFPTLGTYAQQGRFAVIRGPDYSAYLATCGSTKRVRLGRLIDILARRPHLLMWPSTESGSNQIDGMLLPGRQRFSVPVPKNGAVADIEISPKYIYLYGAENLAGATWRMPWPKA